MENYCTELDDIKNNISSDIKDIDTTSRLHKRYDALVEKIAAELPNDGFTHGLVPDSYDIGQHIDTAKKMKVKLKRDKKSRQDSLDKGITDWLLQISLLKSALDCDKSQNSK